MLAFLSRRGRRINILILTRGEQLIISSLQPKKVARANQMANNKDENIVCWFFVGSVCARGAQRPLQGYVISEVTSQQNAFASLN
jgi:hypothetical protein